jgi:segregation and condensation protein A
VSKSKPDLKLVEDTGSQLQAEDLGAEPPPQQSEMPFAIVEGEPVTQLPRDLYIPPDALQVFLSAFEGPLDLLLYLIRKQNLDILNIPIAEITRQYMQYIEVMADLQLELAGEYLLMAAMLAEIKSRMLLPRPPAVEGQEEEDPRAELVRRLQEYERFKKAAEDLDRLPRLERDTMPASAELLERKVVARPPDVTLEEMLKAFRDVLARAEKFAHHHITRERLSQRERMSEILAKLQTSAFFEFTQLFRPEEGRMGVTVTFIAILELMKEGLIEIVQAEPYGPIHVRPAQRHLKVVQGGAGAAAAAEAADAENAAALAQPELVGENDMPDEDDELPPPDDAAVAVQAAVEDVAAASSIALDSVESDAPVGEAESVEAAVAEALAATEAAVETIGSEAVDEAAVDESAGESLAATEAAAETIGSEAVHEAAVDESAGEALTATEAVAENIGSDVVDEQTVDVSAGEALATTEAAAQTIGSDAVDEQAIDESVGEAALSPAEEVADTAPADTAMADTEAAATEQSDAVIEAATTESHAVEAHVVDDHAVEERVVEDRAVEDQVIEERVVEDSTVEEHAAEEPVVEDRAVAEHAVEERVVEEHVVEEHTVEEHVVPEHVVEEHVVPEAQGELSVARDTVTGSSGEADNSDTESSR